VSLSKESDYIHLDEIEWTKEQLKNGVIVTLILRKESAFLLVSAKTGHI